MATNPNLSQPNGRHSESAIVYSDNPRAIRSRARRAYLSGYQKTWIAQRRQQWIDENGPCALCGSTKNLEVDHINPKDKELPPGSLWSMSPQNPRRIAELAKCRVLCENCHAAKTSKEHSERGKIQHKLRQRDAAGRFLPGQLNRRHIDTGLFEYSLKVRSQ